MANKLDVLELDSKAIKAKLICQDCKRNPRPGMQVFTCMCQIYKCGACQKSKPYCFSGHTTYLEPILTMITSIFTTQLCIMSKNGCGEELNVKKLEGHEKYCPFQDVECPVISCTKSIVFNDAQNHMDKTHNCLKVDEEWEFKGTQKEMIQNVCCLSSYGQQFFVQFQKYEKESQWVCNCGYGYGYNQKRCNYCGKNIPDKGHHILLRVIMLGHQDEVHSFQASMTYFHENGKKFSIEVDVLPIASGKQEIGSFTAIPTEKLTKYYDVKAGKFKNQPIQFTLKITNEKLDEIAKDKNVNVESGLEDSDPAIKRSRRSQRKI